MRMEILYDGSVTKNVEYDGTRAEAHTTMYNVTDKKYRS